MTLPGLETWPLQMGRPKELLLRIVGDNDVLELRACPVGDSVREPLATMGLVLRMRESGVAVGENATLAAMGLVLRTRQSDAVKEYLAGPLWPRKGDCDRDAGNVAVVLIWQGLFDRLDGAKLDAPNIKEPRGLGTAPELKTRPLGLSRLE